MMKNDLRRLLLSAAGLVISAANVVAAEQDPAADPSDTVRSAQETLCGFSTSALPERARSERLAEDWRPYIETAIELFGTDRCMFESNYPVDGITASYPVIWNTFKRIARGASNAEKTALFSGTAARIYKLDVS